MEAFTVSPKGSPWADSTACLVCSPSNKPPSVLKIQEWILLSGTAGSRDLVSLRFLCLSGTFSWGGFILKIHTVFSASVSVTAGDHRVWKGLWVLPHWPGSGHDIWQ